MFGPDPSIKPLGQIWWKQLILFVEILRVWANPRLGPEYKVGLNGRWVLNGYFFQVAHVSKYLKHATRTRWLAKPNRGHSHFPHNFQSLYEHLISLSKWRFLCSLDGPSSHYTRRWGPKEIWMDEKSTWSPTWHQLENVSLCTRFCVGSIKKRQLQHNTTGRGKQLNCRWL